MRVVLFPLVVALVVGIGCGADSTTSPSSDTTTTSTTTVASPSATDTFSGTLNVGATAVFSYSVSAYGTVNANLIDISGAKVPSTIQVRLAIGAFDDSGGCSATTFSLVRASSTTQVSSTQDVGTYCVSIADIGNLAGPATFNISVAHP